MGLRTTAVGRRFTAPTSSWETAEIRQATPETSDAGGAGASDVDRGRRNRLFNNPDRNALEHRGDGVTVAVSAVGDGFDRRDRPSVSGLDPEAVHSGSNAEAHEFTRG